MIKNKTFTIGDSNVSAFGDLIANKLTPGIQLDFVYGINTQTGVTTTANSATVDTSNGRLRLQTGTNSAGSAIFNSKRPAKYRPGQGMLARFTPVFDTPKTNSTQIWGVANGAVDGYFFGYNGTTFGICHRVRSVDTWYAQTEWNGYRCDGSGDVGFDWDKTKGLPVDIRYPYLGYGDVHFRIQNPIDGNWVLVHTIRYANTTNVTQMSNPSLNFYGQALNSGNTTNLTMYCGSAAIFITGDRSYIGNPKWSNDSNKSSITTETNLITFRNATTYNGVANKSLLRPIGLSMSSSAANGIALFRVKLNATLGGSPSYTCVNGSTADSGVTVTSGNSAVSYDVAGTTVSNGTQVLSFAVDNPGTIYVDLTPYDIFLTPSDTLTISAFSTNSSVCACALNWGEDV